MTSTRLKVKTSNKAPTEQDPGSLISVLVTNDQSATPTGDPEDSPQSNVLLFSFFGSFGVAASLLSTCSSTLTLGVNLPSDFFFSQVLSSKNERFFGIPPSFRSHRR